MSVCKLSCKVLQMLYNNRIQAPYRFRWIINRDGISVGNSRVVTIDNWKSTVGALLSPASRRDSRATNTLVVLESYSDADILLIYQLSARSLFVILRAWLSRIQSTPWIVTISADISLISVANLSVNSHPYRSPQVNVNRTSVWSLLSFFDTFWSSWPLFFEE